MLELKKIAVTGLMGSGKSTVCHSFQHYNSYIVNTDKLVEQLLISDKDCIQKLKSLLGEDVEVDGLIDKKKIAQIVFSNKELLLDLEKILHPLVFKKMESLYQNCLKLNTYRFFVAEVPLLFEAGWQDFFDVVIYVESDTESNYARLNLPDFTFSDYKARLARFIDPKEAVKHADIVIQNTGTKKMLQENVEFIIKNLQKTL